MNLQNHSDQIYRHEHTHRITQIDSTRTETPCRIAQMKSTGTRTPVDCSDEICWYVSTSEIDTAHCMRPT